jgi:hypothetical protein
MTEPPQEEKRPRLTDRALAEQQARKAREAAALRENLRKRKEQARARAESENGAPDQADG